MTFPTSRAQQSLEKRFGKALLIAACLGCVFTIISDGAVKGDGWLAEFQQMMPGEPETLRIMTLNMAHGRGDGVNQLFQSTSMIQNNLVVVGEFLKHYEPDVVALQEIDISAWWSGSRNQVELIAGHGDFPHHFHGTHVGIRGFAYGTALLSTVPLTNCRSHAFHRSPPTFTKGFVMADIRPQNGCPVTIVSVHLDYSRRSVRRRQIDELIEVLQDNPHSLIVMGDFNATWTGEEKILPRLAEQLKLQAFKPEEDDETIFTYPSGGKRLDWIFISEDLEFARYRVLDEIISDHKGVLAEIRLP